MGEGATNFILFSLHCVRVGKSFFNKNEKKMSCNFFCLESEGVKKSHLQKKREKNFIGPVEDTKNVLYFSSASTAELGKEN